MCHPAIAAIIALASTVWSVNQQNNMADDQADAIEAQAAVNTETLEDKSGEITSKASLAKFERKKQLQREVSMKRVMQSEGGVLFGNTAARSIKTAIMGGSSDQAILTKNEETMQKQVGRQMESVSTGAALQLSGLNWTNPLAAGIGSGSQAYGSAGGFSK